MADRANAVRKIQSLLALAAPKSGATPAERDNAAALAEKMMSDHGLCSEDIPARVIERAQQAPSRTPRYRQAFVVRVHVVSSFGFGSTINATTSTAGDGDWLFGAGLGGPVLP